MLFWAIYLPVFSLMHCPFTIANSTLNSLNITFFIKIMLAEVRWNFSKTVLIQLQTMVTCFGNISAKGKFTMLDNGKKWL